jgi:uncharacterized protein
MPDWLFPALAFTLVLEGLMPFLAPRRWRQVMTEAMKLADGQIRFVGAASIAAGLVLLLLAT